MNKSARIRWAVLLSTLTACLVATLYPEEDAATVPAIIQYSKREQTQAPQAVVDRVEEQRQSSGRPAIDPFAPRGWDAPPPPATLLPEALIAPLVQQEIPAGPPPLPFQFVGRLNDGQSQTVYLSRGDQTLAARSGDMLDAAYKVLSIDLNRINFEYIPTGATQSLTLPGQDN